MPIDMKVKIEKGDSLPEGEYELTDRVKLQNALGNLSYGRSEREKLLEYNRIGGRVVKDGKVLPPQSLWKIEQQHMNKPIEQFTRDELLAVIRRAENTDISGSLYQRASKELEIRNQKELLEATRTDRPWYDRPLGIVVLSVVASLIAAYLIYRFGFSDTSM